MTPIRTRYGLGLDLGVASLGWAMVELGADDRPRGLLGLGVRIFDPGVEAATKLSAEEAIARGQDRARAVARREARLQRRQMRRRAARRRDLYILLAQKGLLPGFAPGTYAGSEARHQTLQALDAELYRRWEPREAPVATAHLLPYVLRERALRERLEPHELGRVLYHLIQRRGFKSNRREGRRAKEKDDDRGQVKKDISSLAQEIEGAGAGSLGAYFARLDPRQQRVRRRFTGRRMFESEFAKIWEAQARHHAVLDDDLRAQVERLLFFQRPIAAQKHLIGKCELEPGERRAPWASLEAERFRVLQKVNDLRIRRWPAERALRAEERAAVLAALAQGDQTLAALRKRLGLADDETFNLGRGPGKKAERAKLPGERVGALMRAAFGEERWLALGAGEREAVVERWRESEDSEQLRRLAVEHWGLTAGAAEKLADAEPEDGYCALSRRALGRLLPEMERGISYKTAELNVYGSRIEPNEVGVAKLPPAIKALPEIRNPAVMRSLTELRKVVNALVREHGKPYWIRVELARDLKRARDERERLSKSMDERGEERRRAEAKIRELGVPNPTRADVDKYLLAEECGCRCPYTGKPFGLADIFLSGQVDVEHILPLSLYADDSFANKTLAWREANEAKGQRTPFQAYGAEEYEAILRNVEAWPRKNAAKLQRFRLKSDEEIADFTSRHLNDTRYASRLARRYLMLLYGREELERADGTSRQAVAASTGTLTATLRRHWQLEAILGAELGKGKQRTDHRHHAVDALVVACINQAMVQAASVAAAAGFARGEVGIRAARSIESPWVNFVDSVRPYVESLVASHRPEHRLSGPLHKETNYGRPFAADGKQCVRYRKPVITLSFSEVNGDGRDGGIEDPAVRDAVRTKLREHGWDGSAGTLKAAQKLMKRDQPATLAAVGGSPIWSVRLRTTMEAAVAVGTGGRERTVQPGEIHHVEIFARQKGKKQVWESRVVTLLDAYERKRRRRPVVARRLAEDPEAEFVFSLMKGDLVSMMQGQGRGLMRVKKFASNGQMWFLPVNDARKDADQTKWSIMAGPLAERQPCKVVIEADGSARECHD